MKVRDILEDLKKSGHTDGSSLSKEEFEKVRGFCLVKSFEMVV